jgi:ribosome-binding protein aMBF1 (putative translation factor)
MEDECEICGSEIDPEKYQPEDLLSGLCETCAWNEKNDIFTG